jgi:flagellar hook protein FlgE
MSSISSIAQSGLQAAQMRLDASAHNNSNLNTPGFRRLRAEQAEAAGPAGVNATLQRAPEAGTALEQDVVDRMSATYAFKANLQMLQTEDRMLGALLDVRA